MKSDKSNEFKSLLEEFMKQTHYKQWQAFLRYKGVDIAEEYKALGYKINRAKEDREDRLLRECSK